MIYSWLSQVSRGISDLCYSHQLVIVLSLLDHYSSCNLSMDRYLGVLSGLLRIKPHSGDDLMTHDSCFDLLWIGI